MFDIQKANLRNAVLAAMAWAVVSTNAKADVVAKPSEIQGLPQTGEISQIRIGSDAEGNVVVSWLSKNATLYLDKITSTGVPEQNATTIASGVYGIHDLTVKDDGSYLAAWIGGVDIPKSHIVIEAVLSNDLSNVLDFDQVGYPQSLNVFSYSAGFKAFDAEWMQPSNVRAFDALGQPSANSLIALPRYSAVTLDDTGDYFLAIMASGTSPTGICEDHKAASAQTTAPMLSLQKNDGQSVAVNPYNQVTAYGFGAGPDHNQKIEFSIVNPKIVSNANGDILLVWQESLATTKSKASGGCSYSAMQTLLAQRFNNDLSAKDKTPTVIASTKNKLKTKAMIKTGSSVFPINGPFLGDFSVDMDDAGDFVIAYALDKPYSVGGSVMVKQFVNDTGMLVAGKAMAMPGGKKPKTSHPKQQGIISSSYLREPSIAITNAANNEFVVAWHHDYGDYYLVKSKTQAAYTHNNHSILKAARYSSR